MFRRLGLIGRGPLPPGYPIGLQSLPAGAMSNTEGGAGVFSQRPIGWVSQTDKTPQSRQDPQAAIFRHYSEQTPWLLQTTAKSTPFLTRFTDARAIGARLLQAIGGSGCLL